MIENNPDKIKEAEIVVGIPSLNEADNIAFITDKIDQGLIKYFSGQKAVIVNSDNNSPDNTGRVFLRTKTKNPKIYISTSGGQRGKGNNLKNLFLNRIAVCHSIINITESPVIGIKEYYPGNHGKP